MITDTEGRGDSRNKQLMAILHPGGLFELDWQASDQLLDSNDLVALTEIFKQYEQHAELFWFRLGLIGDTEATSDSLRYLMHIAATFVRKLARNPDIEVLRGQAKAELEDEEIQMLLANAPYLAGSQYLDHGWMEQAWNRLHEAFGFTVQQHEGHIAELFRAGDYPVHLVGRVYFHLVENKKEGEEYPFSFMSTYAALLSAEGKSRHLPLKNALLEYGENSMKLLELLSTVNKASETSTFIAELVESGDIFYPIGLTAGEAYTFLREIWLYEEAGVICRIPKWWSNRANALKLTVSVGDKPPSYMNADALLGFDAELWLGGEAISAEEIRKLLAEEEGLSFLKGKWVEVNHKRLQQALQAYEQAHELMDESGLSLVDAMRLQLNARTMLDISEENVELEVTNGQWLAAVLHSLTHPEEVKALASAGDDFQANLRVYQERGLNWLHQMKSLGLGACLADDMGLGKTIQVIALLNVMRTRKREKTLLVVPASLIGNWMSELGKFAPSLKYRVYHPSENKEITEDDGSLEANELFITTYGMLAKYEWITNRVWDTLILDEAQAIKNPGTKQTKLVKQIKASYRIAMTGTPIENRLSDLWSLFDFLNKGLLGTAKEFTRFTKSMRESVDGYTRLKQVVSPFILRRLKTDKSIITDLPDKIEMKTYATLTKKQVVLYNKLVMDLKKKIESTEEDIQRKGLVLATLMKFKQICNHPDQYLGQQVYAEEESGKYARLREICETIYEKRERVIIFTQFKEITESLRTFLEQIFQHKGLVLHGGTAVSKRKELVAEFQGKEYVPFMVLSIKAGGVGLNLTSANHVIHFDRWWNPAVENQATDRAFRIGQQKNVIVHKFITQGTVEEKIDLMIEDKMKLSSEIVPDIQESWITEMNNEQIMDLMRLTI
ncbi:DEAD/DEAH box helicase [Paenibacillus sp. 19GGS1-52]|uniref:DEAD/DEAH box helicase n=1 Tax=Paenibacillus sp. 19GGS1-52 TaxID=2758563 RepID=UPI001EFB9BD3|nr:DEAD/DEAH box helicase [Paenibacillus sp. 19GGS1-52]ULO06837.1 DEAD/DEAH box helicase [Paenibacillus sp. 19GGS1-52]